MMLAQNVEEVIHEHEQQKTSQDANYGESPRKGLS